MSCPIRPKVGWSLGTACHRYVTLALGTHASGECVQGWCVQNIQRDSCMAGAHSWHTGSYGPVIPALGTHAVSQLLYIAGPTQPPTSSRAHTGPRKGTDVLVEPVWNPHACALCTVARCPYVCGFVPMCVQICSALQRAALDPRVSGLAIEVGPLSVGYAKLQELRR